RHGLVPSVVLFLRAWRSVATRSSVMLVCQSRRVIAPTRRTRRPSAIVPFPGRDALLLLLHRAPGFLHDAGAVLDGASGSFGGSSAPERTGNRRTQQS